MWFLGHWRWRAGWQEHTHSDAQTLMKQSNFLLNQPSSEQVILFLTSPSPKLQSSAQGFLCSSWISKWEGSVLCKLREANRLHTKHNAGWGAPFADYRWSRDDGKWRHNLPALQKMGFGKSLCLMFPITLIWGQSVTGEVAVRCVCVCPRVGADGRWRGGEFKQNICSEILDLQDCHSFLSDALTYTITKSSGEGLFDLHFQVAVHHELKAGTPSKNHGETKPAGYITRSCLAGFLTQPRRTTTPRGWGHLHQLEIQTIPYIDNT